MGRIQFGQRLKEQIKKSDVRKVESLGRKGFKFGQKGGFDKPSSLIFSETKANADKRLKTEISKFKKKNPDTKTPETKIVKISFDQGDRKGKSIYAFAIKKEKRRKK